YHGKVHRRAAHRLAGVVGAELQRVLTVDDALVGPVELFLMMLVGGEVLERTPVRPGIESHDGEAVLGQTAGESAAARAGAHDRKVHRLIERVLAHRRPTARPKYIRGAAANRSRGAGCVGRPIPV